MNLSLILNEISGSGLNRTQSTESTKSTESTESNIELTNISQSENNQNTQNTLNIHISEVQGTLEKPDKTYFIPYYDFYDIDLDHCLAEQDDELMKINSHFYNNKYTRSQSEIKINTPTNHTDYKINGYNSQKENIKHNESVYNYNQKNMTDQPNMVNTENQNNPILQNNSILQENNSILTDNIKKPGYLKRKHIITYNKYKGNVIFTNNKQYIEYKNNLYDNAILWVQELNNKYINYDSSFILLNPAIPAIPIIKPALTDYPIPLKYLSVKSVMFKAPILVNGVKCNLII